MSDQPVTGGDKQAAGTAKQIYAKLAPDREAVLTRARACAEVTIPGLMPPDGHNQTSDFKTPWQSVGARGLNNLGAKLLLAQFPAEVPFFKITPTQEVRDQLQASGVPEGEILTALAKVEKTTLEDMEASGDRAPLFETIRQLICCGNVLLHIPNDGNVRCFRIDKFVVKRDLSGNVIEIVLEESLSYDALPEDIKDVVDLEGDKEAYQNGSKELLLYTRIYREGSRMKSYQEVCGTKVPKSEGNWPIELCPWLALRMIAVPGEDYGRSYVEEYIGDLDSLEELQKALVEGTVAAARFFIMVNPNGVTKKSAVEQAKNGAVISGNEEDITTYTADKQGDLQVGRALASEIETRLEFAFLMHTAVQRNAERVTAEEIRYMAEELDSTLGGIYTVLSQELQLPYVRLRINALQRKGKLPQWPKKSLKLSIATGLDAIGRGREVQRLRTFATGLKEVFGDQEVARRMSFEEYANRYGANIGIEVKGLIRSDKDVAAEDADNQNIQTAAQVAPDVIKAGSQMVMQQQAQQQQTPAQ